MTKHRSEQIVSYAKDLRNNMTKEENHLWYDFLRSYSIKFTRQEVIGHYIADFYCPTVKLVIEIDGKSHHSEEAQIYDTERTNFFENHGITVIRFFNTEVSLHFYNVCLDIDRVVNELLSEQKQ